jgi:hypothetical protein
MKLNICQSDLAILQADDRAQVLRDIREYGFDTVRFEVPLHTWALPWWKYNWDTVKLTVAACATAGVTPFPVLGGHMPLFWKPSVTQYADWCADAMAAMNHVAAVNECEIWNEPNLGTFWRNADPVTFHRYAEAAYHAVKDEMAWVTVVSAGLAAAGTARVPLFGANMNPVDFYTKMIDVVGEVPFCDEVGYHPYNVDTAWHHSNPAAGINLFGLAQLDRLYGMLDDETSIVATEFGFNTDNTDPSICAQWFLNEMEFLDDYVARAFLYCWRDTGTKESLGLITAGGAHKTGLYDTVKTYVGERQ